jgi:ribonuclease HI
MELALLLFLTRNHEFFCILPKPERQVLSSLVSWLPPRRGYRKINIDGSIIGAPSCGAIGVVFRDCEAKFLGGFVQNIGHAFVFVAELYTAMYAIEKAVEFGWSVFWIKTDPLLVVKAFSQNNLVPWPLRVRWKNCLALVVNLNYNFYHIHREGNSVADALAKNGHNLPSLRSQWWEEPPLFILPLLHRDEIGLPYMRISNL